MISDMPGSKFEDLKCLVLGGGGFIGLNLCRALNANGAHVRIYAREITSANALPGNVELVIGEFSNLRLLNDALNGCNVVIHLVNQTPTRPNAADRVAPLMVADIVNTANLLDLCQANAVKKLLFASSGGSIYGVTDSLPISETAATEPISPYGISKLTIEKFLAYFERIHGIRYLSLRIGNPYGRYQPVGRGKASFPPSSKRP